MGKQWKKQRCRCTICGEEFESITKGREHGVIQHDRTWNNAKKILEEF